MQVLLNRVELAPVQDLPSTISLEVNLFGFTQKLSFYCSLFSPFKFRLITKALIFMFFANMTSEGTAHFEGAVAEFALEVSLMLVFR